MLTANLASKVSLKSVFKLIIQGFKVQADKREARLLN